MILESEEEKLAAVRRYQEIPRLIKDMQKIILRGRNLSNRSHARSWTYLAYHAEMCLLLCQAMSKFVLERSESARASALELVEWARRNEKHLHHVLDVALFLRVVPPLVGLTADDLR